MSDLICRSEGTIHQKKASLDSGSGAVELFSLDQPRGVISELVRKAASCGVNTNARDLQFKVNARKIQACDGNRTKSGDTAKDEAFDDGPGAGGREESLREKV